MGVVRLKLGGQTYLRLHDRRSRKLCLGHGDNVFRLPRIVIWVVPLDLFEPDSMYQSRLRVVRFRNQQGRLGHFLFGQRLGLTSLRPFPPREFRRSTGAR